MLTPVNDRSQCRMSYQSRISAPNAFHLNLRDRFLIKSGTHRMSADWPASCSLPVSPSSLSSAGITGMCQNILVFYVDVVDLNLVLCAYPASTFSTNLSAQILVITVFIFDITTDMQKDLDHGCHALYISRNGGVRRPIVLIDNVIF